MAETSSKESCVAGFVKGPVDNHDKSFSFWVAQKKFVVSAKGEQAAALAGASRALVRFREGEGRNPKITAILTEPSAKLIQEHMKETGG